MWSLRAVALVCLTCVRLSYKYALARPIPKGPVEQPDYTIYHTKEETFDIVRSIVDRHPSIMKLHNFSNTIDGYSADLLAVQVEPAGLGRTVPENKIRLLLNFGEHGRELVTVEVALKLLELLGEPEKLAQLPWLHNKPMQPLLELLHRCSFMIVPMENVNGRSKVERGQLCERKNGRGVDPNRNWDLHWGFKEKDYDPNEEFPGKSPFSEPEPVMMRNLAETFHPHAWVNFHSGMEALFMPYDHQPNIPSGDSAAASLHILESLNQLVCNGKCAVGSGGKSVGYLAHGTATDYMYEVMKVPVPFTWEIYGDATATYEDCFKMFNPLKKEQLEEIIERWVTAVMMLVELLPAHPALPNMQLHDQRGLTSKFSTGGQTGGGANDKSATLVMVAAAVVTAVVLLYAITSLMKHRTLKRRKLPPV